MATRKRPQAAASICVGFLRAPLEHREAILVMHEVTGRVVEGAMSSWLGWRKIHHQYDSGHGLRERSATGTGRITDEGLCSPPGRY